MREANETFQQQAAAIQWHTPALCLWYEVDGAPLCCTLPFPAICRFSRQGTMYHYQAGGKVASKKWIIKFVRCTPNS